ncbi:hypothetical protein ACHAWF_018819 [Thalassiosira exigua]
MGDYESISSDWESVKDDDGPKWEGEDAASERIVLELPSDGLDGAAEGASGLRGDRRANDDHNDARSAAGSSISSFVPVSRFDKMSMQQKVAVTTSCGKDLDAMKIGSEEATAGKGGESCSMSSFAHVSQLDDASKQPEVGSSSIAGSDVTSYPYISEASSHAAAHADADDDSVLSNFEVLSLSSGDIVLRCKRCTFHNATDARCCAACDLALVANPNVDVDAQIAAHIAQAEENARRDPFFDHACALINDVVKACRPFAGRAHALPQCHSEPLAVGFVKTVVDFPDPKSIILAYKCTSNGTREMESIQRRGIEPDQPFLNPTQVEVSHSLENAMESFETLQMMRGELYSIREDSGESARRVPDCLCWIVAIVAGSTDTLDLSGLNTSWPPNQTLPVAYFDTSSGETQKDIHALRTDLNRTLLDGFFAQNLNLPLKQERSPGDPFASKCKRQDSEDDDDSAMTDAKRQKGSEEEHTSGHSEGQPAVLGCHSFDDTVCRPIPVYADTIHRRWAKNMDAAGDELFGESPGLSPNKPCAHSTDDIQSDLEEIDEKSQAYEDAIKDSCAITEEASTEKPLQHLKSEEVTSNETGLCVGGEPFSWHDGDMLEDDKGVELV